MSHVGTKAFRRWRGGPAADALPRLVAAFVAAGRKPRSALDHEWLIFRGTDLRGKTVLDIGAGDGLASAFAVACGARKVLALEPEASGSSGGAVAAARKLHKQLGYHDRIEIREQPVEAIDTENRFDVILLAASINHLDEEACSRLHRDPAARALYRPFLERLHDLCEPGGQLIAVDCSRANAFPALGLRNPIMTSINWRIHQRPQLWAALLREAGFRDARIDWLPVTRKAGLAPILSRSWIAYFINSYFRLRMRKA
jgi:SAM-dependent methyltransferase